MRALVLFAFLMLLDVSLCAETYLRCSGEASTLTNSHCSKLGEVFGCYYVRHFSQYRTCASICNDIISTSIDEMRCIALCPDYRMSSCLVAADTTTTTSVSSSTTSFTSSTPHLKSIEPTDNPVDATYIIVIICIVVLAAIATIFLVVCVKTVLPKSGSIAKKLCQRLGLSKPSSQKKQQLQFIHIETGQDDEYPNPYQSLTCSYQMAAEFEQLKPGREETASHSELLMADGENFV